MEKRMIFFALLGFLSGSVLYARVFSGLMNKNGVIEESADHNPGTANAFQYGGFWCGLLTLSCDLLKGYLPVRMCVGDLPMMPLPGCGLALVLAAPVVGHAFPIFYRFQGGKGIAVSFGCLLGLLPVSEPFVLLAGTFLTFSLILRISPNYYRTAAAYVATLVGMFLHGCAVELCAGFAMITATVCLRLCMSHEVRERVSVKLLWMH